MTPVSKWDSNGIIGDSDILTEAQEHDWCQPCRKIPLARIFRPARSTRQKRYTITHSFVASCPMCRFIRQLEVLDQSSVDDGREEISVSTGKSNLMLSTYDTHEPWWHVLGLTTSRPMPHFAWFQREGSANALRSEQPLVLVTMIHQDTTDSVIDVSVPRRRSESEQDQALIDLIVVRDWLRTCDVEHGASCRVDTGNTEKASSLWLIDVNTRDIIESTTGVRYVALSYVWGNRSKYSHGHVSSDLSTSSDLSGLVEASYLKRIPQKLPATLEDAVTVCQALGEQYLWIDLFCIDQSNHDELRSQINQMNKIYQKASFTIIARGPIDAYEGLPGISRPLRKRKQPTCITPHGKLAATHLRPAVAHSGKAPWDLRGWTLQESLFSHRKLSFSNHSVRMTCQREYFHDSLVNTLAQRYPVWLTNRFDWWDDDNSIDLTVSSWEFKNFNALVSVYTNRILRYSADILNACRGALLEIELRTGAHIVYGIPTTDAHRALLWTPHFSHTLSRRRGPWPSWSWCAWMGRVEWRRWIVDVPKNESEADISNSHGSTLNRKSDKKRRMDDSWYASNRQRPTEHIPPATLSFPSSEDLQTSPILHVSTLVACCTLVRAPTDAREPTILTFNDKESGTATKKDLGYHWTLLSPTTTSPLTDITNSSGEPDLFVESDHFLRLSKEESSSLERHARALKRRSGRKRKRQEGAVAVPAELLLIKHWDLIRDSEEHDAWLADMVGCLVVVPAEAGAGKETYRRVGMVLLEKEVLEAFKPKTGERDIV